MKLMKVYIIAGILCVAIQIILGLILYLVFQWGLVETIIYIIVNVVIFIVVWGTSAKVTMENSKELKE